MDDLKDRMPLPGHFHIFVIDQDGNQLSKCGVSDPSKKFIYELIHQSLDDGYNEIIIKKMKTNTVSLADLLQSEEYQTIH